MRRGYLSVGERRVHYRVLGEGPPVVMLHGSPGDSQMLTAEMAAAASNFTCVAFDAPGFGDSDPLAGEALTVVDLARATAEAMAAMGLEACPVYGTHTGAAIAIELAVGWPERVTGVVLEGLPVFTPEEMDAIFTGYFAPMIPDALGGHLTATWMRFRDQFTWFPWLAREVARLNAVDRPTPDEIELWVSMFYRSCKTYAPAYRAACFYGQAGIRAAQALKLPGVYMASAEDMLFPHLDRLPPMKAGQRIERLAHDASAKPAAITAFLAEFAPRGARALALSATPVARPSAGWPSPRGGYVDTPSGQMFVRSYGDPAAAAVIVVHDALSTGFALDSFARGLADRLHVVVPDLPGAGRSDAPALEVSPVDAAATGVCAVAQAMGLERFVLAARGFGAAVAAELVARGVSGLTGVVLDTPPRRPDGASGRSVAPDLAPSAEGAHWVRAWLAVRDGQIYAPWFDGRVSAQRRTQGNFDAQWLHDQTVELMRSRASCGRLAQACVDYDAVGAFAAGVNPVHVEADEDFGPAIASLALQET